MARLYSQERGKFGSNVGFIYPFIVTLSSDDPDDPTNAYTLPAGFLKCDGTIYDADNYPALAGILGVGESSKFIGDKTLLTDKFRVPDLGAKIIRASRSDVGSVNDATVQLASGAIQKKSGVGVEIDNNIGEDVEILYSGNLKIPERVIDINGNPGWTVPRETETVGITNLQIQPHGHYSTSYRMRHADDTSVIGAVYSNSRFERFGSNSAPNYPHEFDTNIQNPIIVGGRNIDVITEDGGNDDNTEHDHSIFYTPGINHQSTSTGFQHSFQITTAETLIFPDGLVSSCQLSDSGKSKFDDVISPYILVQYIIKF